MSLLGDLIIATLVKGPQKHRVLYFFQLVPNDGGQIRLLSGLEYSFHIVIQPTNIKLMENNMCLENQIQESQKVISILIKFVFPESNFHFICEVA